LVEFGEEQREQQTGAGEEKQSDDQPLQISKHMIQASPTNTCHPHDFPFWIYTTNPSFIHSLHNNNSFIIHTPSLTQSVKDKTYHKNGFNYIFPLFVYPSISDQWTFPSQDFSFQSIFSHFFQVSLFSNSTQPLYVMRIRTLLLS
jgi:hypothetical protein